MKKFFCGLFIFFFIIITLPCLYIIGTKLENYKNIWSDINKSINHLKILTDEQKEEVKSEIKQNVFVNAILIKAGIFFMVAGILLISGFLSLANIIYKITIKTWGSDNLSIILISLTITVACIGSGLFIINDFIFFY